MVLCYTDERLETESENIMWNVCNKVDKAAVCSVPRKITHSSMISLCKQGGSAAFLKGSLASTKRVVKM